MPPRSVRPTQDDDAPAIVPGRVLGRDQASVGSGAEQHVACVHADRCAGCPLIGLPYGDQLTLKRGRVTSSTTRYPALADLYTEPVSPAEPIVGYRTRAKLVVGQGGALGLFEKGGGHNVVDIPRCRVLSPTLGTVAGALRELLGVVGSEKTPCGPLERAASALRAVDLREVLAPQGPRALVTLVVDRERAASADPFEALAQKLARLTDPLIAGVAIGFHDGESSQILGGETTTLYGATFAEDDIGSVKQQATYGSFVQVHRPQAERLRGMLVEWLNAESADRSAGKRFRVLDLYGGSGAIALALAKAGADVLLVDALEQATDRARASAVSQGLGIETDTTDAATALRRLASEGAAFDAIIVNPPRRGMSASARELLALTSAPRVAYVSCDPDTLARDLDHLHRLGFEVTSLRPFDMVPLTDEVETVAFLKRTTVPRPVVAYEDDEIIVVEKPAHEATAASANESSCLASRVRTLTSAGEAVPLHTIDVTTSGLVMFAKTAALAARWSSVMASPTSRTIFVAGVRGVTPSKGAINRELREGGQVHSARTRYRRLAVANGHSVLRVVPEQSRTHQVRRHLASIGHPVLGDDRYGHGPTNRFFEEKNALDRVFLHVVRLEFDHPGLHERVIVEAKVPGDLCAVLDRTSGPATLRALEQRNALGHTGHSTIPPAPSTHDPQSALEVDASTPSLRPEPVGEGDDDR